MELEKFISSHRAKLNDEKAKLGAQQRSPRGILPQGSYSSERERLQRERQSEYQDFLERRLDMGSRQPAKSIAEVRKQMQQEREREITPEGSARAELADLESGTRGSLPRRILDNGPPPFSSSRQSRLDEDAGPLRDRYTDMKQQRLAEEKQYRNHNPETAMYGRQLERRRRWDDEPQSNYRVKFEEDHYSTRRGEPGFQHWEDEEELMHWAKSRGRANSRTRNRAPTPPIYDSPRKPERASQAKDHRSLRSVSAPVIAEGISALGARDDPATKRNKQREYAEELRAQMREKEEAKQRERLTERGTRPSQTGDRSTDQTQSYDRSPKHDRWKDDHYHPHDDTDGDYPRRPPRPPYYEKRERYAPYPPPHGHIPHYPDYPPYGPPMDYPSSWVPPYYHPRPTYPSHPPVDPYYPPPHPSYMGDPYLPPRRPDPREFEYRNKHKPDRDEARRPRFEREDYSPRFRESSEEKESTSPLTGGTSRSPVRKQDKASYRAELEKQMKEKKEKETKEKYEKERYDLKMEQEIYDPWGKGGCGAPVRGRDGKPVTDLKRMHRINNEKLLKGVSATSPIPPPTSGDPGSSRLDESTDSSKRLSYSYDPDFRKNEEIQIKTTQEEYRDYLKRQVEEKEAVKRQEKEMLMMEEKKEAERLERERLKLQEDYQHERQKQKKKEEEVRAKNEAIKQEAEEKRRAAALQKQKEEWREVERERRQLAEEQARTLAERMEQPLPQRQRSKSPPIPVLRHKMNEMHLNDPLTFDTQEQPVNTYRSSSPPVPALQHRLKQQPPQADEQTRYDVQTGIVPPRSISPPVPALRSKAVMNPSQKSSSPPPLIDKPPTPQVIMPVHQGQGGARMKIPVLDHEQPGPGERKSSADTLRQLSVMRRHLRTEQDKLSKYKGDGSGPSRNPEEIFEMARSQKPRMAVPRARAQKPRDSRKEGVLSAALSEFNELRYKPSRREFLEQFPDTPQSGSALEFQQDALLRHQEESLARLRAGRMMGKENTKTSDLLMSESKQLPLNVDPFSGGLSVEPSGAPVRGRRQRHLDPSVPGPRMNSAGGQSQFSITTFDVDSIARRNEERMHRLDTILNASTGEAQNPQTVLHNFLRQSERGQRTIRSRQSEASLDCETGFHPIASPHS